MAVTHWSLQLLLMLEAILLVGTERAKPPAVNDTMILVTDMGQPGRILIVDLQHMNFSTLPIKEVQRPVAVDYDPADDRVYWTDVFLKQIRTTDLKKGSDIVLVQLNISATPDGIAVDVAEGVVFYTDAGNNVLCRVDLDSRLSQVIVEKHLHEPRAVIVHREKRKLYWTDWGENPKIETSDYDGADRESLVSTGLAWPNGLALDTYNERLFWCDAKKSVIESIQLDGSGRRMVLSEPTAHYFDIFYSQGMLYFTDWQKQQSLLHVPACGGVIGSLVSRGFRKLAGLHVISRSDTGNYTLPECSNRCDHCVNVTNCDNVTGRCPDGCKNGWTGDTCSTAAVSVTSVTTSINSATTSVPTVDAETMNTTGSEEVTVTLRDPAIGFSIAGGSQSWTRLSVGMTVSVALGCFTVLLFMAIIALVTIHKIRRRSEKERFNNLEWLRQQAFTNNTYTLMAGDVEEQSEVYLVPFDDPDKHHDDADHLYEDIDELKK